jgi:hypothetical protein
MPWSGRGSDFGVSGTQLGSMRGSTGSSSTPLPRREARAGPPLGGAQGPAHGWATCPGRPTPARRPRPARAWLRSAPTRAARGPGPPSLPRAARCRGGRGPGHPPRHDEVATQPGDGGAHHDAGTERYVSYLYSSDLSGSDVRALTDPGQQPHPVGVYGPILSPDETLVAFRGSPDGAGGTWAVGSDGSGLRQISATEWGLLSWQSTP